MGNARRPAVAGSEAVAVVAVDSCGDSCVAAEPSADAADGSAYTGDRALVLLVRAARELYERIYVPHKVGGTLPAASLAGDWRLVRVGANDLVEHVGAINFDADGSYRSDDGHQTGTRLLPVIVLHETYWTG